MSTGEELIVRVRWARSRRPRGQPAVSSGSAVTAGDGIDVTYVPYVGLA